MKEINIAKKIVMKRKEKGITQDELAAYIGISKASVSKWETAQSYPDITFLPQLASYFNISIDELIGYSPQLTKDDIRKLYHHLSEKFSSQPFDEVITECRAVIKKYYSCFPLLLQMVVLLLNHHMLAKEKETQNALLQEIIGLCVRIKAESEDVWLSKQANSLEAFCYMALQQPQEVLELLDGTMKPLSGDEIILANAYQMVGNVQKAKEALQVSIYQHLLGLISSYPSYLLLFTDKGNQFERNLHRILSVLEIFELDKLHPNAALQVYYAAAHGYAMQGNSERALDMLSKYGAICTSSFFPFTLHGDEYFDAIDEWFDEFDLGAKSPRDEKLIKESMIQSVTSNPAFEIFAEQPRYKNIVETMKNKLGGNEL
jgi:transcriptional regulator with XRE-family HTH domain